MVFPREPSRSINLQIFLQITPFPLYLKTKLSPPAGEAAAAGALFPCLTDDRFNKKIARTVHMTLKQKYDIEDRLQLFSSPITIKL